MRVSSTVSIARDREPNPRLDTFLVRLEGVLFPRIEGVGGKQTVFDQAEKPTRGNMSAFSIGVKGERCDHSRARRATYMNLLIEARLVAQADGKVEGV